MAVPISSNPLPLGAIQPVSKEIDKSQAEKTFWGLKDRFWMQIIDGKYHPHGPMVFDEAKHAGKREPGFFSSLKAGCEFSAAHLTEKPTVPFYKELQKILCAHFTGNQFEDGTQMHADKTGIFRDANLGIYPCAKYLETMPDIAGMRSTKIYLESRLKGKPDDVKDLGKYKERKSVLEKTDLYESIDKNKLERLTEIKNLYGRKVEDLEELKDVLEPEEIEARKKTLEALDKNALKIEIESLEKELSDYFDTKKEIDDLQHKIYEIEFYINSKERIAALEKEIREKGPEREEKKNYWIKFCDDINACIQKISNEINMPIKTVLKYKENRIDADTLRGELEVEYGMYSQAEYEAIVEKLFSRYELKIQEASKENSKEDKLKAISELYAILEWLHPFEDGQGRTDLVLQCKLLCDEGFNPAILDNPYTSSFTTPADSLEYLKKGIVRWQDERAKV